MTARVVLGELVGRVGYRGALRVRLAGDDARNLKRADRVALTTDPDTSDARHYGVAAVEETPGGFARLELAGVATREAAEALQGLLVVVDEAVLEPLPEGEYYWYQLVGCEVWSHAGARLGTLKELWDTGGHDILVVEDQAGRELLLPAARELLRELDPGAGRIVVEVPAGLLEGRSEDR